jgi:hypothetical protein
MDQVQDKKIVQYLYVTHYHQNLRITLHFSTGLLLIIMIQFTSKWIKTIYCAFFNSLILKRSFIFRHRI